MTAQLAQNLADLMSAAEAIFGKDAVLADRSERDFYSSDLYQSGEIADLVIAPASSEDVASLVKFAAKHNLSVFARGGGRSYSNAFLPDRPNAILLDTRRLNRIRKIDPENLIATVECGCTWKVLDEALSAHGLRSVFWGPASGAEATIGGSMSQGTANNQAGLIETSSNAVTSYEIVTGTGEILNTGLDAQSGRIAHFRPYGPDLTGLFNADAGALGLKTAVTLKLEPRPSFEGGVSFAFSDFDSLKHALHAAGREGLASAIIAMDSETAGIRSGESGLIADFKKLLTIVGTAHNPFRGLWRGVKIGLAGRKVFETATYTAHFLAEGSTDAVLISKERALRKLVSQHGSEIPSAAISMMRAALFPDLPTTDFTGRRMIPIHGIAAWGELSPLHKAYTGLFESYREKSAAAGITIAEVFSVLGRGAVLFEPVFYWQDSLTEFHTRTHPSSLPDLPQTYPENLEARALVEEIKTAIIELMSQHGTAHLQIGKLYPYMHQRTDQSTALLLDLKRALDPDNIINPGALGLAPESKDV